MNNFQVLFFADDTRQQFTTTMTRTMPHFNPCQLVRSRSGLKLVSWSFKVRSKSGGVNSDRGISHQLHGHSTCNYLGHSAALDVFLTIWELENVFMRFVVHFFLTEKLQLRPLRSEAFRIGFHDFVLWKGKPASTWKTNCFERNLW